MTAWTRGAYRWWAFLYRASFSSTNTGVLRNSWRSPISYGKPLHSNKIVNICVQAIYISADTVCNSTLLISILTWSHRHEKYVCITFSLLLWACCDKKRLPSYLNSALNKFGTLGENLPFREYGFAPWFSRVEIQNVAWLFFMSGYKKWGLALLHFGGFRTSVKG